MTVFSIYAKPDAGPEAVAIVPDRFVWTAFFFTPLWALAKGALGFFGLWAVVTAALSLASPTLGGDAAFLLYAIFSLWSGFAAPQIAARALQGRDWLDRGIVSAPDVTTAERLWLEKTYGARS